LQVYSGALHGLPRLGFEGASAFFLILGVWGCSWERAGGGVLREPLGEMRMGRGVPEVGWVCVGALFGVWMPVGIVVLVQEEQVSAAL
jgi:hypothetical protein